MIAVGTEKDWFITHGWKTKHMQVGGWLLILILNGITITKKTTLKKKSKEHSFLHAIS
jgi:hypothetical protein